jgi:hypothetical protein
VPFSQHLQYIVPAHLFRIVPPQEHSVSNHTVPIPQLLQRSRSGEIIVRRNEAFQIRAVVLLIVFDVSIPFGVFFLDFK